MDWNATSPQTGLGILIEHNDPDPRGFNIRCNGPIVDFNVTIPVNCPVIDVPYKGVYVVTRGTEWMPVYVPGPAAPEPKAETVTSNDRPTPKPRRKKKVTE